MKLDQIRDSIFQLVAQVPTGKVTTYKALAEAVGTHPRVIGRILHTNDDPQRFPCHRVVHTDGRLAGGYVFGGPDKQQQRLTQEGVVFTAKNRVDKSYFV